MFISESNFFSFLVGPGSNFPGRYQVKSPSSAAASEKASGGDDELFSSMEQLSVIFEPLKGPHCNSLQAATLCAVMGHFLVDFFPAQDLLNKAIGEFLSNQQNHYKSLTDILFVVSRGGLSLYLFYFMIISDSS